jgi:hypothetical protein
MRCVENNSQQSCSGVIKIMVNFQVKRVLSCKRRIPPFSLIVQIAASFRKAYFVLPAEGSIIPVPL